MKNNKTDIQNSIDSFGLINSRLEEMYQAINNTIFNCVITNEKQARNVYNQITELIELMNNELTSIVSCYNNAKKEREMFANYINKAIKFFQIRYKNINTMKKDLEAFNKKLVSIHPEFTNKLSNNSEVKQ